MTRDSSSVVMRGPHHEAARPKYAHLEIERRWLVDAGAAVHLELTDPVAITDRYIIGTRMRLRMMRRGDETVFKLTRKYECEDPVARPIVTAYLNPAEYEVFAALPALTLGKTRYKVRDGAHEYSLDRFAGPLQGLWLSEIELPDLRQIIALADPPWAVRDVTNDPAYQGANLARCGIPE
jgi:CYTH domain-containing protein